MNSAVESSSFSVNPPTPTADSVQPVRTQLWRHARVSSGYFLDISKIPNVTEAQHLEYLADQYGGADQFIALKVLGKNSERYIEVYPSPSILSSFTTEGVLYEEQKLRLLPCKALTGESDVVQLNLTELPPLAKEDFSKIVLPALAKFGEVLDYGLKFEPIRGFWLGAGYAVIHRHKNESYPKLEHTISLSMPEDATEYCYATFPDMPVWCRYCHAEGHTKYECAKSKARILCYSCDQYGHMSKECPSPRSAKKTESKPPFKKARKTGPSSARTDSAPELPEVESPPSDEALKSQWAPSSATTTAATVAAVSSAQVIRSPGISKYSQNRFETLTNTITTKDLCIEDDGEDMDDEDYRPENDDRYSTTDDDLDSDVDVAQDEVDVLMQESTTNIDSTGAIVTVNENKSIKLHTFVGPSQSSPQSIEQSSQSPLSKQY